MSDYLTFKLWKAGVFLLVVFVWGLFCGATGRSLNGRKLDQQDHHEE